MSSQERLSDFVKIDRHYRRSIRLDADLGRSDALEGYICHGTARAVLDGMCRQLVSSAQRAFTWTGPFGGGKSSLAVILASALLEENAIRQAARARLAPDIISAFDAAFPVSKGWTVVAVSGRRTGVVGEIARALNTAAGRDVVDPRKCDANSLVHALAKEACSPERDGLLLVIDEMGKFLEASALGAGDDVHFFQDLAERAARCDSPFVVVGVLHQAFRQYASRLGSDARDDWAKVQGRFTDIPLVASSDEVVELVGKAVTSNVPHEWTCEASEVVSGSIRARRPAVGQGFGNSLDACWPLHPTMAALLGPISKRQFGQNERSTFGFLSSVEPHGFASFLEASSIASKPWYRPGNYWDFLRANLEPSILASTDGHRWAQAVDAVERVEAKGDSLRTALIKNVAVIDLFRNGSGLAAEPEVLRTLFPDVPAADVDLAMSDLASWRAAIFRKHTGSWAVFEGSDFDIEAAVTKARSEGAGVGLRELSKMAGLHPVVAKRHYHETGNLRWMEVCLADTESLELLAGCEPDKGAFGRFILYIPSRDESSEKAKRRVRKAADGGVRSLVFGVASNHERIVGLAEEFAALRHVSESRHELVGDSVARREISARLAATRSALEDEMRSALDGASWIIDGLWVRGKRLSPIASDIADADFFASPHIFSELVNRDSLSPNAVKARRDLLHRMLDAEEQENLGLEGWPAERGLHETLLRTSELHCKDASGAWRISAPSNGESGGYVPLWAATDLLFSESEETVPVSRIYSKWRDAPFGMRSGCMPVLLLAYILSRKDTIAAYKDGMFVPRLTDADVDECLQDSTRFSLRRVAIDHDKTLILSGISEILAKAGKKRSQAEPLDAARGLVGLVFDLPDWARRTRTLSSLAAAVRDILLRAKDPHKVLFVDLPATLGATGVDAFLTALESPLLELAGAYQAMISGMEARMVKELGALLEGGIGELRRRAAIVEGVSGDFRLNAFAARLAEYDGSVEGMEGILSLAANKPPRLWADSDIDSAALELASWATKFKQVEALAAVKGRAPTREAFAVVVGSGADSRTLIQSFDISDRDMPLVEDIASDIVRNLGTRGGVGRTILLAALAKAGFSLVSEGSGESTDG